MAEKNRRESQETKAYLAKYVLFNKGDKVLCICAKLGNLQSIYKNYLKMCDLQRHNEENPDNPPLFGWIGVEPKVLTSIVNS